MHQIMREITYKVFSCGVEGQIFKAHYAAMAEEECRRLDRVAWRMWLTLQLRYRAKFSSNFTLRGEDSLNLAYVELPSLEIYLLLTCLDTLAGDPKWSSFDKWLKEHPVDCNLNTEGILDLFELWREDHGPRRTIRKLFEGLPSCVTDWLSEHIVFQKYSADKPIATKLFNYFYDERRNEFTHSSVTRHTVMAIGEIELPSEDDKWWSHCADGFLKYRQGFDLATILRIIIYAVILQKLCVPLSMGHLNAYLEALSKLDSFYSFKWEIATNREELSRWAAYNRDRANMILRPLNFTQSHRLAEKLKTSPIAMEQKLAETIGQYLHFVKQINSDIADFEATHPREPFEIPDTYRQELAEFFPLHINTDAYRFVHTEMFNKSGVISIDLFIREVFVHYGHSAQQGLESDVPAGR
jgi:hypothetical protein